MRRSHDFIQRLLVGVLTLCMVFVLAACGGPKEGQKGETGQSGQGDQTYDVNFWNREGYRFVVEEAQIKGDVSSFRSSCFVGDRLYYLKLEKSGERHLYVQEDGVETKLPVSLPSYEEGENYDVACLLVDGEDRFILPCRIISLEKNENGSFSSSGERNVLLAYSREGEELFRMELSQLQEFSAPGADIEYAALDEEGHVYIACGGEILLFDENGGYQKKVSLQASERISALVRGKDGVVYVYLRDTVDEKNGALIGIDYEKGVFLKRYGNLPEGKMEMVTAGRDCDFLLSDGKKLYEYSLEAEAFRPVADYQECGVFGSVMEVGDLGGGSFLLLTYENGVPEYEKLVWREAGEEEEKIKLVLGVMSANEQHKTDAARFNKANDRYELEIREYMGEGTEGKDAAARLNADLVSGNGPDILDISADGLSAQNYVSKGLLLDLSPLMEQSSLVSKEDFLDAVIEAYTIDGCLAGLPLEVSVHCLLGPAAMLEEKNSMSVEDMIALIEGHPGIPIMTGYTKVSSYEAEMWGVTEADNKAELLEEFFRYNADFFLDYEGNTCRFDSPEFRSLVELAEKCVPVGDDLDLNDPWLVANGRVLFNSGPAFLGTFGTFGSFSNFSDELYELGGGEKAVVCGYPRIDGGLGIFFEPASEFGIDHLPVYGILKNGKSTEGAWEFVESCLAQTSGLDSVGISTRKAGIQAEVDNMASLYPGSPYETDAEGNVVTDAEGNPVRRIVGNHKSDNYEPVPSYVPLQEEWDDYFFAIENARMVPINARNVYSELIEEEMTPYFAGDKTLDEALDILQSRAALYMSEGNF